MKIFGVLIIFFTTIPCMAVLEYHSERIKLMDIEVLQKIMVNNLKKMENKEEEPGPILKQSLELLLAQPDQGLAVSNIFEQLRTNAGNDKILSSALSSIIDDALPVLKKDEKNKDLQREQNTYVYILNNMLNEVQKLKDIEVYKSIIERIRDADIVFNDHLISHRLLNSMAQVENPSKYAQTLIPKKSPWWKFW